MNKPMSRTNTIKQRFRGFLPVVVDVETTGIDPKRNALLEVSLVLLAMDEKGRLAKQATYFEHVLPFDGAEFDSESMAFHGIDPDHPLRYAVEETIALTNLFAPVQESLKKTQCQRAVLVGHNAWFDLLFMKEAATRTGVKFPFHAFTCFDTATLSGLLYGQTVLAKAAKAAGISFDTEEAHSALYDADKTAELFCVMVNTWESLSQPG